MTEVKKSMDCHVAALLAMTMAVIASAARRTMDCRVAALLAMTEAWPRNDASTASQQQKHGLRLLKMIIVVYGYF